MTEYLARVETVTAALDSFIRDVAILHDRCRDDRPGLVEAVRLRLADLMERGARFATLSSQPGTIWPAPRAPS